MATAFDYWDDDTYYLAGIASKSTGLTTPQKQNMFIYMYDKTSSNFDTAFYEDPDTPTGRSIDTISW